MPHRPLVSAKGYRLRCKATAPLQVNGAPSAFEGFDQASSERESLLETQVTGLRQQLDAKDAELVELRQQTGEIAVSFCSDPHL